ncbi:alanine racemase [Gordonia sp. TBRC 11910]|uniref:Alanine racemase n=1 Tax=Gordonia asplenii TaxID=2725283 RepID=A0A848KVV0_9ACTN|nr:alanine racemase [Gordonia asplenii]NMO02409.1 alanine racemase [Gordonia asplenii]
MTEPDLTATIDLSAIAHNVGVLRDASGVDVLAVVKADAYGHGAVPVARTVLASGAVGLGVARMTEALALREAGIDAPITAWLHTGATDFAAGIDAGIDIAVSSQRQLDAVVAAARVSGRTAIVSIKVDTGLRRSGVAVEEWSDFTDAAAKALADNTIELRSMMTHLARGDEPDDPLNSAQAAELDAAVADFARIGIRPHSVHVANSPAALTRPDLSRDLVRPGIAVYGRSPIPRLGDFGLIPAMEVSAQVALVKRVRAGEGVSYGHEWIARRDSLIAVIPAGYADGVPRAMSGKLRVGVNGRIFDAVGRVCMDQFVIDLGPDGGGVVEGDRAVLFGSGADGGPTALDWAEATGTIDYEIVSGIGARVVRRYIGGPRQAVDDAET